MHYLLTEDVEKKHINISDKLENIGTLQHDDQTPKFLSCESFEEKSQEKQSALVEKKVNSTT
jgi:hypothetical protein